MQNKGKVLPPLDYLLAFESAAKNGSFAAAGRELNVSETAVSRKVRLLEQHYDIALFVRGHRSIALTIQGKRLLASVEQSLDMLRSASRNMFSQRQKNAINLARNKFRIVALADAAPAEIQQRQQAVEDHACVIGQR